ncbi:Baculoviral IAP repeat-containing protein 7-A [Mizuhopecten yessoensis]|uniref:Baculoviral IAP repeat-containing protein 7-A n=1 Tax=Mizuhopecten yessoensis TaxID=6573 RepID=A0A210R6C3_MIZYE|nr:Baculoviral IAP repeat-containing protein 7-A [Mizuhopecten yessoensis]
MDNYLSRLATFFSFPFTSPVSTTSLAESGFHYTGNKDEVACHRCLLRYSGWQRQDNPMAIHITMSPNCTFVLKANDEVCNGSHCNFSVGDVSPQEKIECNGGAIGGPLDGAMNKTKGLIKQDKTVSGQQSSTVSYRETDDSLFATRNANFPHKVIDSNLTPSSDTITSSTSQTLTNEHSVAEFDALSQNIPDRLTGGHSAQPLVHTNRPETDSLEPEIHRSGEDIPNTIRTGHAPVNNLETNHDISSQASQALNAVNPRYPQFAVLAVRFTSYKNWPTHLRQKPEELAKAGLFYEGTSDYVRCFYCAGGLREWEPEDDPFIEHARWFPFCEFMRLIKDDQFIMAVQAGTIKAAPQEQSQKLEAPKMKYSFDEPAVLSVMEMGYNEETIAKAIELFSKRQGKTLSAEILLSLVWEIVENDGVVSDEEHGSRANENVPDVLHGEVDDKNRDNGVSFGESRVEDVVQLQEENQALRDRKTCKVCLDEEASIVFLPCGHLVTCPMCASALRKCPICRTFIRGTVKAIVS